MVNRMCLPCTYICGLSSYRRRQHRSLPMTFTRMLCGWRSWRWKSLKTTWVMPARRHEVIRTLSTRLICGRSGWSITHTYPKKWVGPTLVDPYMGGFSIDVFEPFRKMDEAARGGDREGGGDRYCRSSCKSKRLKKPKRIKIKMILSIGDKKEFPLSLFLSTRSLQRLRFIFLSFKISNPLHTLNIG